MKILMISSEAVPFAKTGGLADAVSSLSLALAERGHDVRILLPRYYSIPREKLKMLPGPLGVPMGSREEWCAVYEGEISTARGNVRVPVYFLDHEGFFGRDGIYGSYSEPDFRDNPYRFAFFSRAAFQVCRKLHWIPDILHAHDWPAALVPVYLKYLERSRGFEKTYSVFTIHNLGYQGIYGKEAYPYFGLDWSLFQMAGFEDWDRLNLLKAALTSADKLTTVSPTYAEETKTPAYGFRMDGVLRARSHDYVGILNGIDTTIWNPQTDPYIPRPYSAEDLSGKALAKETLQKTFGLPQDPAVPIVGMVGRLTDQKGIGELFGPNYGAAWSICTELRLQMVVLGSGERWCEQELRSLASRLPNLKVMIGYDEKTSHLIEAGSDFFLMPSRYEPCGLNQMYSLVYGTPPIVRRTGGLADSVENYNQQTGEGTGFMFDDLTPRAIYDTVGWAIWAYYNRPDHITAMRKRGMQQDFSWNRSASRYEALYQAFFS
ncbi:MAG: glycogen synthase GlgA [Breznakiellaceae bacterium]